MFQRLIAGTKKLYSDLNTDNGRFSHTRFWSNIAYATATVIIVKLTWSTQLTPDFFLIYMGVVGAHSAASKLISQMKDKRDV